MNNLISRIKAYRENHGIWSTLKKQVYRVIELILTIGMVPIIILLRFIKPFIHIRFGPVRSDVIGHFVFDTEYYLSLKEINNNKTLDLFYYSQKLMPNSQWPIMVNREITIHPLVKIADKANHLIPGWEKYYAEMNESSGRDIINVLSRTKPHIQFTKEELKRGHKYLQKCGLKPSDKFVCVICRDSTYKNEYMNKENKDWSYHSYRDSDISNYEKTIDTLANKGFYIFRMGKGVSKKIDESNSRVIDYANSKDRSDFLDIYLFVNNYYSVLSEAGIITVANAYRKPHCYVNLSAIEYTQTWNSNSLTIFKKYWDLNKKRFMTFKEIYASGAGRFLFTKQYDELGIELIENTPDEILDVSMELHHRLNNTWETAEEDEVLQKMFWDSFPKSELHGEIHVRIGADFLRQNRELLN
jgi:putative glycosyltransferase (TIGR04372 family)